MVACAPAASASGLNEAGSASMLPRPEEVIGTTMVYEWRRETEYEVYMTKSGIVQNMNSQEGNEES